MLKIEAVRSLYRRTQVNTPPDGAKGIDSLLEDTGDQVVFVLVVPVESGPIDHGSLGYLPHGNGVEASLSHQVNQGIAQQLVCAPDPKIGVFLRHFRLLVV